MMFKIRWFKGKLNNVIHSFWRCYYCVQCEPVLIVYSHYYLLSSSVVPPKADAPVPSSFIDFGTKDGDWDCEVCTVRNDGTSSRCARCSQPNPNMKSKNAFASAPTLAFGSSLNQPATAGFEGTLYGGFNQSKEKASSIFGAPSTRSSGGFTFGYKFWNMIERQNGS